MRDVQHILVFTAVQFTGAERVAWVTNGAGFKYSDSFGFGLLQASRMVHAAKVHNVCVCVCVSALYNRKWYVYREGRHKQ